VLGSLGAFVFNWSLIQQVVFIIPASFGIFFIGMLFDRGDWPERARLFRDLNTPIDVERELKDSPDYTVQVFRFLSRTVGLIGGLSLLLIFSTSGRDRLTVVCFAGITLLVSFLLRGIHEGRTNPASAAIVKVETAR
jgi:hypothetical protein